VDDPAPVVDPIFTAPPLNKLSPCNDFTLKAKEPNPLPIYNIALF
jgi:hypothetical protein